jgi:hypothetical protein
MRRLNWNIRPKYATPLMGYNKNKSLSLPGKKPVNRAFQAAGFLENIFKMAPGK